MAKFKGNDLVNLPIPWSIWEAIQLVKFHRDVGSTDRFGGPQFWDRWGFGRDPENFRGKSAGGEIPFHLASIIHEPKRRETNGESMGKTKSLGGKNIGGKLYDMFVYVFFWGEGICRKTLTCLDLFKAHLKWWCSMRWPCSPNWSDQQLCWCPWPFKSNAQKSVV